MQKIFGSHYHFILISLLIATIILRIDFTFLPSFKIDMNTWEAWTGKLTTSGPATFYAPNYFADYLPGYLYLLWFMGLSFNFLFPNSSIFSSDFEVYLKLFTNLFDFMTAFLIYKIIQKHHNDLGLLAAILYLINPALTFNSSIWGQNDGILAFFLVLSVYFLVETKKHFAWSFSSATSIIDKPQGVPILPISIIYFLKDFNVKKLAFVFLIPVISITLSLPFFLKDPIFGLFHLLQKSASTYPYTSMFSYNLWSFAGFWVPDSTKFGIFSYQIWGYIIFITIYFLIIFPLVKRKTLTKEMVYLSSALAIFAFFLFLTRIHQRYLYYFFPFFLIFALLKKSVHLTAIYFLLTFIHFINLSYVYFYYNYVYQNSAYASEPVFQFLSTNYNILSTLNLLFFGILLLVYYRLNAKD